VFFYTLKVSRHHKINNHEMGNFRHSIVPIAFLTLNSLVWGRNREISNAIEWHIPVGCGFSGFYTEFLGLTSSLVETFPELRIVSGQCSLEFYSQLFDKEATNFRRLYDPAWARLNFPFSSGVAVPANVPNSDFLEGVDISGNDLPRSSDGYILNEASDCDSLCNLTLACVGWTYRRNDQRCWLKANVTKSVECPGLVSKYLSRPPLRRIDVWHGRCEVDEIKKAQKNAVFVVARLMTESNHFRNTPGVLECALAADEIWVPSNFHLEVFKRSGVREDKLIVIPEAVDPDLWIYSADRVKAKQANSSFVFLSVFKWERRKGWDILLDAYWEAFGVDDNVVLRLRSWKPSWEPGSADIDKLISDYALSKKRSLPSHSEKGWYSRSDLPMVEWIGSAYSPHAEELTRVDMRNLYRSVDCFVLASRGEGWGLPAAEAMTMGIPTIVTNFSGPTAFATSETAYLIPVSEIDRAGFAIVEVELLVRLLRQVYLDNLKAQVKGAAARNRMSTYFSPKAVGSVIANRLKVITGISSLQSLSTINVLKDDNSKSKHRAQDEL
jgi:glycosyltransferase involved in cell wall biosynthesis